MKFSPGVPGLAALLLAASAVAAEPWLARKDGQGPAQVAAAFPESAAMLRRNLVALIEAKQDALVSAELDRLAAMGFALSPAGQEQTARYLSDQARKSFNANAASQGKPVVEIRVPKEFGLVEGAIAVGGRWVASNVTAQDLLVSDDGKKWRLLGLKGLGSISGLAADQGRGRVWAAAGVFDQTPRAGGAFSGLVLVDPRAGRIVRRVAAPPGVVPGDIALGSGGTVFVSDPISGGLWQAGPGAVELAPLVAPGVFRSPQGIAPSADGRRLYVSDYGAGLAMVEIRTAAVTRLSAVGPMMLDGIDGLLRHGNELVAMQNGTRPMRIVSIRLSPDGTRASSLRVLMQRLPGGGEPTAGQIRGGRLHYVANARWDAYGKGGVLADGAGLVDTEVHSLQLSPK